MLYEYCICFSLQGSDALKGKLKADFFQLVEEQTQNEVEVAKRHLESAFQLEKDELFDLLNKEKQSMEDQFNDRYVLFVPIKIY